MRYVYALCLSLYEFVFLLVRGIFQYIQRTAVAYYCATILIRAYFIYRIAYELYAIIVN